MDTNLNDKSPFFIGNWEVQPPQNRLLKKGDTHSVEPKVMEVLVCLAKKAPDPVSRADLFKEVWNGDYVSDDVLTRSVSILRKIFGDNPKKPKFIETIPKYGYALLKEPVSKKNDLSPNDETKNKFTKKYWGSALIAAFILLIFLLGITLLRNSDTSIQQTEIIPVTSMSGNEFSPSVSPNGDEVVFSASDETGSKTDIFLTKIEGGTTPVRLTKHRTHDVSPVWSPSGERIAFVRYSNKGKCHILFMDRWGDHEKEITKCNERLYPTLDWSPDGKWIAFPHNTSAAGSDIPAIYLYSLETDELIRLTNPPGDVFGDFAPRFSSDGKTLTFLRSVKEGIGALVTINLETQKEKTLFVDNYFRIRGFDWYEEPQTLILSANRTGNYGLWKYDIAEKKFSTLLPGNFLFRPQVLQNGTDTKIIYEDWKVESNIYRLDLASPEKGDQSLITSSRMDFQPSLSTGNKKMAFLSNRSGNTELWIADRDGSGVRTYQTDIELMPHTPLWSPSGEKIAFSGLNKGISQIFVIDIYSNNIQQLTNGDADKINPTWSADGKHIYYSKYENGQWNIYRKLTTDGKEEPVLKNRDAFFSRISADGNTLYYTSSLSTELYAYKLNSNNAPELIAEITIDPDHRQDWRVTADGLYFFGLEKSKTVLNRYLFEKEETEQIYTFNDASLGTGLAITDKGDEIYFVKIDRSSSDLVMLKQAQGRR